MDLVRLQELLHRRASLVVLFAYAVSLIVYNVLAALISGWIQWILVLAILAMSLWVARYFMLSALELGTQKAKMLSGVVVGLSFAGIILVSMIVIFVLHPDFFTDDRYAYTTNSQAFFKLMYMLLRTVLVEEFIFRGVLLALLLRCFSTLRAVAISSLLFGLWHIMPSLDIASSSSVAGSLAQNGFGAVIQIIGIVIATACAGVLFCYARLKSSSLIAPVITHWSINGVGLVLAMLSVR